MSIFIASKALNHPSPEDKQQQQPGLTSALLCTTVKPLLVQVTKKDPEPDSPLQPDGAGNVWQQSLQQAVTSSAWGAHSSLCQGQQHMLYTTLEVPAPVVQGHHLHHP